LIKMPRPVRQSDSAFPMEGYDENTPGGEKSRTEFGVLSMQRKSKEEAVERGEGHRLLRTRSDVENSVGHHIGETTYVRENVVERNPKGGTFRRKLFCQRGGVGSQRRKGG